MPIEAHGGKIYSDICIENASNLLQENFSVNIFPEGAYIEDKTIIHRGRTGAARILFDAYNNGINANIIPVAINILDDNINLDSYEFNKNNIEITILPSINYENAFDKYINSNNTKYKNEALHSIIDEGMKNIADTLNRNYTNEYIELFKKGNVIFSDGNTVSIEQAQNSEYVNKYKKELTERKKILQKEMLKEMTYKY